MTYRHKFLTVSSPCR